MEDELQALRTWSSTLTEAQHTVAIYQFILETTPTQVKFLLEVLKTRNIEFGPPRTAFDKLNEDTFPIQTQRSATSPRLFALPYRPGPFDENAASSSHSLKHAGRASLQELSPPISTSSMSVRSGSPTHLSPIYSIPPTLASTFDTETLIASLADLPMAPLAPPHLLYPLPSQKTLSDLQNALNRKLARLHLFCLAVCLSQPLTPVPPTKIPTPKPERKPPKYPFDEKDPGWLWKWLRALRLHKYTENLQGMLPRELLELNEKEMVRLGVDTLGARTKLLAGLKEAKESLGEAKLASTVK